MVKYSEMIHPSRDSHSFGFRESVAPLERCSFGFQGTAPEGNNWTGVELDNANQPGQKAFSVQKNTFSDLPVALLLQSRDPVSAQPTQIDFTLRCNEFINHPQSGTNPLTRKGLVIEEGVQLRAPDNGNFNVDEIGGPNGFTSGNAYPNANVWLVGPGVVRGVRPEINGEEQDLHNQTSGWTNSLFWKAIENQSGTTITYWRYDNEFVGWGESIVGMVNTFIPPGGKKFRTPAQSLLQVSDPNYVDPADDSYEPACATAFDNQPILFPARISVVDSSLTFTSSKTNLKETAKFGEPVPNPTSKETKIEFMLPVSVEQAVFQVFELGTGRVIQTNPVAERGKLEINLDVSKASSGVYGCRLLVDGKSLGIKKLVVIH